MFERVRSLAVYVSDLEQAKEFYTGILGFKLVVELGSNLCFLKSNSGNVSIYMEAGKKHKPIDNKTCRLSFFLQTKKTASEAYTILKDSGVKLLQKAPELRGEETACFQFEDPDGNIIEVCGKP